VLDPLVDRYQGLKVVFEHITTRRAVQFVESAPERVAATITPQHLSMDRNALFSGGIRPHHYCLPVLKQTEDRAAVLGAAIGDDPRFFLGTDSAPHPRTSKEKDGGAAGIFSAHAALPLYAEAFDRAAALDKLEAFASHRGADFYGLVRNTGTLTLLRESWEVPGGYPFGEAELVPLRAGGTVAWRVAD
jgi:dihydroorotase